MTELLIESQIPFYNLKNIFLLDKMSVSQDGESYSIIAKLLDTIEFPDVIKVIETVHDGKYNILPYLTKVQSSMETINPYNLTRCCRIKTLILPNCKTISDNVLMLLPYLESLTIRSGSALTPDVFRHLNYLTKLQIISRDESESEKDTLVCLQSLEHLTQLEMLHVHNAKLRNEHFYHLRNLKVLVLDGNPYVSPAILNYLPRIEICIINKKLYKYISSTKNNAILKKIGKINRVKIYAVENNKYM